MQSAEIDSIAKSLRTNIAKCNFSEAYRDALLEENAADQYDIEYEAVFDDIRTALQKTAKEISAKFRTWGEKDPTAAMYYANSTLENNPIPVNISVQRHCLDVPEDFNIPENIDDPGYVPIGLPTRCVEVTLSTLLPPELELEGKSQCFFKDFFRPSRGSRGELVPYKRC
ncbi:hypothetical protein P7C73_g6521, partial [Tremellales sp. Uapishka_1]